MLHECQIEQRPDVFSTYKEQYLITCRCHDNVWHIMQPDDPAYVCPAEPITDKGDK